LLHPHSDQHGRGAMTTGQGMPATRRRQGDGAAGWRGRPIERRNRGRGQPACPSRALRPARLAASTASRRTAPEQQPAHPVMRGASRAARSVRPVAPGRWLGGRRGPRPLRTICAPPCWLSIQPAPPKQPDPHSALLAGSAAAAVDPPADAAGPARKVGHHAHKPPGLLSVEQVHRPMKPLHPSVGEQAGQHLGVAGATTWSAMPCTTSVGWVMRRCRPSELHSIPAAICAR
jgi:hypothetical protein